MTQYKDEGGVALVNCAAILKAMPQRLLKRNESLRYWVIAIALIVTYGFAYQLASLFGYPPIIHLAASAAAAAALFFLGLRFSLVVWLAALIAGASVSLPPLELLFWPLGEAAMAAAVAFGLRRFSLDPIFRTFRDMLTLILAAFAAGFAGPIVQYVPVLLGAAAIPQVPLGEQYAASVAATLIVTPFVLRWFGKRHFNRNLRELVEIVLIFGFLVGISVPVFFYGITQFSGVSLLYFLLIPLFWISLRLRPRFVTLAFMTLGTLSVAAALTHPEMHQRLMQTELFLIVLSIIYYIVVSLEEDRRRSSNLMRQQLMALENAVARISSESKAKNEFIAVLAHELRNPLAPVVSGIDLLKLKQDRDQDEQETLDIMEDRMKMVRRLLDDLLDISRITENKITITKSPVDLEAVLKRSIVSTEHYRSERHQTLSYKSAGERLTIMGDAARLEQVFSNLLTNASKYSDPGTQIRLSVGRTGEDVRIQVKDAGMGIDPSLLETVFKPFHQIESGVRSIKGLGIGLALVRTFVELHDGTVQAHSEGLGHGSEFVVTLPLKEHDGGAENATVTATPLPARYRKVLVVDDNDTAAAGIGKLLELQGHTVHYAYTGRDAVIAALDKKPDIILLDLNLPDIDGYTVAKRLKAKQFAGRIIALTGLSSEDAKSKGARAGLTQYLVKPIDIADLKAALAD